MDNYTNITACIVLYNENINDLENAVHSFLNISNFTKHLFLVDNSPQQNLPLELKNHPDITYVFNNKNLGFAKAQNLVLDKIKDSKYHLVLNPDVTFKPNIIQQLIETLKNKTNVAVITPKIQFPNGKHQYNVRKYPTFFDLIIRKLNIFKSRIHEQEYRNKDLNQPFYPEAIHGAFMLFKSEDFISLNGFDERYFLYMEDIDICKKIDLLEKKKYYDPSVQITHVLQKESSKKIKLFLWHLSSAFKYFVKW
ncbi:glycosyltransferase [Tenacibaculum jejuense]|uniref:Glycosyl transferase, group 2 family protein n=1 Tax=Tenacibaculum jejuense TaxID=584609 RepID=A0A238UF75_9FLAO|nr:glycosyltransferase [Tenacibaculum jejuense]SNR17705.1 Glycosyl transferase, group 2 family protein [Tenacibaculum jejuense]